VKRRVSALQYSTFNKKQKNIQSKFILFLQYERRHIGYFICCTHRIDRHGNPLLTLVILLVNAPTANQYLDDVRMPGISRVVKVIQTTLEKPKYKKIINCMCCRYHTKAESCILKLQIQYRVMKVILVMVTSMRGEKLQ
jgi:hypothetical protein